jgi:hypothetical protein
LRCNCIHLRSISVESGTVINYLQFLFYSVEFLWFLWLNHFITLSPCYLNDFFDDYSLLSRLNRVNGDWIAIASKASRRPSGLLVQIATIDWSKVIDLSIFMFLSNCAKISALNQSIDLNSWNLLLRSKLIQWLHI